MLCGVLKEADISTLSAGIISDARAVINGAAEDVPSTVFDGYLLNMQVPFDERSDPDQSAVLQFRNWLIQEYGVRPEVIYLMSDDITGETRNLCEQFSVDPESIILKTKLAGLLPGLFIDSEESDAEDDSTDPTSPQ